MDKGASNSANSKFKHGDQVLMTVFRKFPCKDTRVLSTEFQNTSFCSMSEVEGTSLTSELTL